MKKLMSKLKNVFHSIIEVFHPSDVIWKTRKATLKDSGIVLVVSALTALLLIGADSLFGFILNFIL